MNKKTKKTVTAASIASIVVLLVSRYSHMQQQVCARFPELDPKVAKAAYNKMMRNALMGKYPDIQDATEEEMDELFLHCVDDVMGNFKKPE